MIRIQNLFLYNKFFIEKFIVKEIKETLNYAFYVEKIIIIIGMCFKNNMYFYIVYKVHAYLN